jgi:hypothetical protein
VAERTVTFDDALWVLVPRVPTEAMKEAMLAAYTQAPRMSRPEYVEAMGRAHEAMLAASPSPPETAGS